MPQQDNSLEFDVSCWKLKPPPLQGVVMLTFRTAWNLRRCHCACTSKCRAQYSSFEQDYN